ncbi:PHB depolymerase family esterase [Marimonas sp. MJW-29]|uniref:PHB depolymerase family esterase n=1 Tax=Sulfitobacter sediminis TaxID=3234186 RepID=A0ABV3RR97_9RHOB
MRLLLALLLTLATPALACGPDSDCPVGDRIYRIAMPEGWDGNSMVPAVVWSHGYRGSAAGVMRNGSMRRMLSDAGYALIAAQGVNGSWDLPFGPRTFDSTGAAEFAYFEAVLEDAAQNHHIDPARIIASGFSAGGMMVWNLACARPGLFAGFIPYSGTFWLKPPDACAAPVASIVHIHGTQDETVPLKGRPIGETHQGEVEEALSMYETFGGFGASAYYKIGPLTCRNRSNAGGETLQLCLFEGGHSFRTEFLGHGINELVEAGQL